MCTVSYIPGKDRVLFTSGRDENPRRKPASPPKAVQGKEQTLFYPADGAAGGSWIGVNSDGNLLIVLNGGFINHTRKPAYRTSRGLIMTMMLDSNDMLHAWNHVNLEEIEPFTMIAYIHQKLHQFVWTGFEKSHLLPDPSQAHIWSSSTLYNTQAKELRRQWFHQYIHTHPAPGVQELLHYFLYDAPKDNFNGFTMNRDEIVKTCSWSVIELTQASARFLYHDALLGENRDDHFYLIEKTVAVGKQ